MISLPSGLASISARLSAEKRCGKFPYRSEPNTIGTAIDRHAALVISSKEKLQMPNGFTSLDHAVDDAFISLNGSRIDTFFDGAFPAVGERVEMVCVQSEEGRIALKLKVVNDKD